MMAQVNPFAKLFLHAAERLRLRDHLQCPALRISIVQPLSKDPRRYNLPRAREVGASIPNCGDPTSTSDREIILHGQQGRSSLNNIEDSHPGYLPLRFVLLLPFGTQGWTPSLQQGFLHGYGQNITDPLSVLTRAAIAVFAHRPEPMFISLRQWHSYHLFCRQHCAPSPLLLGEALMQEWVVDAWATIEQRRLQWLQLNQTELRLETYNGFQSAVEDGLPTHRIGQRTLLPASHVGSPRYMHQTYQDCMAIVRHAGRPTLFITMTSNTNWSDICQNLRPGQSASSPIWSQGPSTPS